MRKHGVKLDFLKNQIVVTGVTMPTIRVIVSDTNDHMKQYQTVDKKWDWLAPHPYKAWIEEEPDKDANSQWDALPEGSDTILLSKEEYDSTLKEGEVHIPLSKTRDIRHKSASNVTDGECLCLHVKNDMQLKRLTAQKELLNDPAEIQPEYSRYLGE